MDLAAQLRLLRSAQGDPARLALAAVDIAFARSPESEREALKEALEAAAIPHWCTDEILAALLDLSPEDSRIRFAQLERLNEVERFEARGESAVDVHEASRLALRTRMAREELERFRALSARAAGFFAGDGSTTAKIEWIYHRLCAAPDDAAEECAALNEQWEQSSSPQNRDALALALYELETSSLVTGRARLEVLLGYAENLHEHTDMPGVAKLAPEALELAKQLGHAVSEARAYDLVGGAELRQNEFTAALEAYQAALRIRREVAADRPADATAQARVAVALNRTGDVMEQHGFFQEALDAYNASSRIWDALTAAEPENVRWFRETVMTSMLKGDILVEMGQPEQASRIYEGGPDLFGQLVAKEPDNDDWKRDLAYAQLRIVRCYGVIPPREVREALEEALHIFRELLSKAPNDSRNLEDVQAALEGVVAIEATEGRFDAAEAAIDEARGILDELLARDPGNSRWRMRLAQILNFSGRIQWQRRDPRAYETFTEALTICRELATRDPAHKFGQRALALAHVSVAIVANAIPEHGPEAVTHLEEASRIYAAIVAAAPENAAWAIERMDVDERLAAARKQYEAT